MPNVSLRPTGGRPRPVDGAVAIAVTAFCVLIGRRQTVSAADVRPADLLQVAAISVTCLPLALRRPWPTGAAVASTVGCAWYLAAGYTAGPVLLVPLAALYFAGYAVPRRRVWQLVVVYTVVIVGATFVARRDSSEELVWLLGSPAIAAAVGFGGNAKRRHEVASAERAAEEDRRQFAEARQRLAEERLQTARDVHDVVGHSLASITLLAAAGSRRVAGDPDSAREVLDEIRSVSATALSDVRRALDAMNDPTQAIRSEGADDLTALFGRLRRVGLRVDDSIDVDLTQLDPATVSGLYGIAQESLTNVMRHAGTLQASVSITQEGGDVTMTVVDDGFGGSGAVPEGVGISGMRRRAQELGGRLDVGWSEPPDRRGLRVVASLPAHPGAGR